MGGIQNMGVKSDLAAQSSLEKGQAPPSIHELSSSLQPLLSLWAVVGVGITEPEQAELLDK